jgi:transposase
MPRQQDPGRAASATRLAASGMSRPGIAAELGVSERTIARWLHRPRGRPPASGDVSRTTEWRRGHGAEREP